MLIPISECQKFSNESFGGILHVGAHCGEEAKSYNEHGIKQVLWVEANKALMKPLYDNVKMLPMKNEFANEVLGDIDGKEVIFNITNNGQSSSILPLGTHKVHHPQVHVVETQTLRTKRFDTFYKEKQAFLNLFDFDFINIDVQGAELMVLKGFGATFTRFSNIKTVYCRVYEEELYEGAALVEEIDAYLSQFGFVRKITKMTEYKWGDALYLRA